ncbi:MAG: class I SAM-dependent methyltransferase [Bacteroidetes bacterium]|nr:class I SAM-dependent methyltransferase [Bacteroidota bacterium]
MNSEKLFFPYKDMADFYVIKKNKSAEDQLYCELDLPVPPKDLWLGYGETPEEYLKGKIHIKQMLKILTAQGYKPEDPGNILDFGCGAGRMIRWLKPYSGNKEIWGVDISSEHILWANNNLNPPFNFAVNTTIPHLPFGDGFFSFIYAGSVFTHIDDLADSWFLELNRITSDNGLLYLTVQDRHSIELLDTKYKDKNLAKFMEKYPEYESEKDSFNIMVGGRGPGSQVFYDIDYLKRVLNNVYEFVSVNEEAYGYQTALLLKKKKSGVAISIGSDFKANAIYESNPELISQLKARLKSELISEIKSEIDSLLNSESNPNLKNEIKSELSTQLRREFNADKLYFPYKDTSDFYLIKKSNAQEDIDICELNLPIPPKELWLGYGATTEEYLKGKIQIDQMLKIASAEGYNPEASGNILDFGCGAGRMMRWLKPYSVNKEIWGVDISSEHILWANNYLNPPFHFAVNTFIPHLPFKDGFFDFIYAGSVFTHIDDLANSWFLELNRISSENAYLYLTIQDRHTIELLDTVYKDKNLTKFMQKYPEYESEKENFNIMVGGRGPGSQVFYDIEYIKKILGNTFEFASINEEAYGYQTALLLRKKKVKI